MAEARRSITVTATQSARFVLGLYARAKHNKVNKRSVERLDFFLFYDRVRRDERMNGIASWTKLRAVLALSLHNVSREDEIGKPFATLTARG
jgi:hypothetical protein